MGIMSVSTVNSANMAEPACRAGCIPPYFAGALSSN